MTIDLYYMAASAPCRAVMLTAKALDVSLNLKTLDLSKGEHLSPEFIKINPQHTIPTLVDNGFVITESRAIIGYLVDQYSKTDSLYPKDAKKRAVVNQRLYFDQGTLYERFSEYCYPLFHGGSLDEEKKVKVEEALGFFDKFLEGKKYAAGNELTIADISLAATVSTIAISGFDLSKHGNVNKWFTSVKTKIPGYEEINEKGLEIVKSFVKSETEKLLKK